MRHTPRGAFIRRRLAADPVVLLKARRLRRRAGSIPEGLLAFMAWLTRRSRRRDRTARLPLLRRYAGSVMEHVRRSERLARANRLRLGRPRRLVRIRWVVAGVGGPSPRDTVTPPPAVASGQRDSSGAPAFPAAVPLARQALEQRNRHHRLEPPESAAAGLSQAAESALAVHAVDVVADRKHGLACDRVVREYYLLARDSADELAMERLGGKALTQDALLAFATRRSKA